MDEQTFAKACQAEVERIERERRQAASRELADKAKRIRGRAPGEKTIILRRLLP